jgi:AraC-like DNA-binding protein
LAGTDLDVHGVMRRKHSNGWLVRAPGVIDRIEARLSGMAYAPHRHDTYAIGVTLKGVQRFDYRGATRYSRPGQMFILHPDELHDGRAGDDGAFHYRTVYVAPADIQEVLGGCALPFIAGGVSDDQLLYSAVRALLDDYDQPVTTDVYQDWLFDLASALGRVAGAPKTISRINRGAVMRARDFIDARLAHDVSLDELARVTQHDRWQLSRDFRTLLGTSPYRYLILRRLDRAREMMLNGHTIADAAAACGFADQSHFGRSFKKSFGMTPNAWLGAVAGAHDRSIPA